MTYVSVDPPRPLRARSAFEKSRRRDDILRAAERLWATTPYADLSMNHVAREASLAKGTLYLYFSTKEELFLALLHEYLQQWFRDLEDLLDRQRPQSPEQVSSVLVSSIQEHLSLRRLLLLLTTVLERDLGGEKEGLLRHELRKHFQAVTRKLPFSPQTNGLVLSHFYALTLGWQQLSESRQQRAERAEGLPGDYDHPGFDDGLSASLCAVIRQLVEQEQHSPVG